MISWVATKTYISALYMNDTMVVTGSGAGIVKLWDLPTLLHIQAGTVVTPLRSAASMMEETGGFNSILNTFYCYTKPATKPQKSEKL